MTKQKEFLWIILLLVLIVSINYKWVDSWIIKSVADEEIVYIDRVIDGDTIKTNGTSIRLLGINSPEKGEKSYQEAKDFLEIKLANKSVKLEYGKDKTDKYGRTLAYVFLNGGNINLKIVEEGYANFYFPSGKDLHYNEFKEAWEKCIEENKNLCEKSKNKCVDCVELKKLDYISQEVIFYNKCEFNCNMNNWDIKDEGRKHYKFNNFNLGQGKEVIIKVGNETDSKNILYWKNQDYVWTKTRDSLFLRDDLGKLVLWESY